MCKETIVYKLKGILDISTNHIIESYFNEEIDAKELILNFNELTFIDSTGIGALINIIYWAKENQCALKLIEVDESINEIFETVGLYQILENFQEVGI